MLQYVIKENVEWHGDSPVPWFSYRKQDPVKKTQLAFVAAQLPTAPILKQRVVIS